MLGSKICRLEYFGRIYLRIQSLIYDFLNAYFKLKLSVTIAFALPSTNRGNKGIRATSACEQQGGKLTLQLAWLAGKELVTVPRYQDLLPLETGQHSNLDLISLIFSSWT